GQKVQQPRGADEEPRPRWCAVGNPVTHAPLPSAEEQVVCRGREREETGTAEVEGGKLRANVVPAAVPSVTQSPQLVSRESVTKNTRSPTGVKAVICWSHPASYRRV